MLSLCFSSSQEFHTLVSFNDIFYLSECSEMVENSPAVLVRKAYKQYGRGTKAQTVFVNLNMTVSGGSM